MADHPDPPDGGDLKETLGKKLGPLPVGVWILAVGGGLVFAWFMRTRIGASADEEEDPGRSTDTQLGIGGGVGGGGGSQNGGNAPPSSNEEWYQQVSKMLLALGIYDALAIDTALKTYLSGARQLTAAEQTIVSHAIRLLGPPPVPTPVPPPGDGGTGEEEPDWWDDWVDEDPVVPTTPPPVTTTPTPQSDPRPPIQQAGSGESSYTVASGDTLYEIAERKVGKPKAGAPEPTPTRLYRDRIYERNISEIEWQARKHGRTDSTYGQYLYAGTQLVLPPKTGSSASSASSASTNLNTVPSNGGASGVTLVPNAIGGYTSTADDPYAENDFYSGGQVLDTGPRGGVQH